MELPQSLRNSLIGVVSIAFVIGSSVTATTARADENSPSVASVASAVRSADDAVSAGALEDASSSSDQQPDEMVAASAAEKATAPVDVEQTGDAYQVDSKDGFDVSAPHDPADPVVAFGEDGSRVEVTLPEAEHLSDAKVADDGATVIYTGDSSTPSVAVQSSAGGLRIHTVIAGPEVDSSSTYSQVSILESDWSRISPASC